MQRAASSRTANTAPSVALGRLPEQVAEDTVRRAMVELATKLDTMAQELQEARGALVGVEPAVALGALLRAGRVATGSQRRFLDVGGKVEDATATASPTSTKCVIYHSWAKPLLACISPAARKVAAGPLAWCL